MLVQLFFWFNGVPLVFKHLTIAVPFTHVTLYTTPMVKFMTPFMAALLGLALNEGAYMAEIVRAGILSVDQGQTEAAQALGMTPAGTMRRIVLPQAMRVIIPPTGNEFISMLKTSSLASVVTYGELLRRASDIYSTNLEVVPLLVVASLWYLAITSVASVGQYFLERRYGRAVPVSITSETPLSERMVVAEGVHKRFGRLEVLKGIDLTVDRGEVMVLLGPSGSGKSTFLRCINHLEKIDGGRISVDGELVGYREAGTKIHELREREVAGRRAQVGMVFQHFNLFPHMTARRQRDGGARAG